MTKDEMRAWIDRASYESLLSRWRFAPVGSPWFQDEIGEYYQQKMIEKRAQVGDAAHVTASKSIGWREGNAR